MKFLPSRTKPATSTDVVIVDQYSRPAMGIRRFEGAKVNRLTLDWHTTQSSIDNDLRWDLRRLIDRSRDMVQNDSYAEGFLKQCERNVVGATPFILQMKIREPDGQHDKAAEQMIEQAWKDFCKPRNLTTRGNLSMRDVYNIVVRQAIRDGGVLIRKHRRTGKYGLKIELMDIDYLDVEHNETLQNGHVIRMGVETNQQGEVVAYWLLGNHPGDYMFTKGKIRTRVPAVDIYHVFIPKGAQQTRGYPEFAACIRDHRDLKGYREAEIVAARTAAGKMGFLTKASGDGATYGGPRAEQGGHYMDAEPGAFEELPAGMQFQQWDPQHPTSQYKDFVKEVIRSIATSLGVSYMTFANDAGDANYSSARVGLIDERETWKMLQAWMVDHFVEPLFSDWLFAGLGTQAIPLPLGKYEKFCNPHFQGKRWPWVDPKNDMEAAILAMDNGIKSPADIVAEFGGDEEEVLDAISNTLEARSLIGLVPKAKLDSMAAAAQQDEAQESLVQSLGVGGLQAMMLLMGQVGKQEISQEAAIETLVVVFGIPKDAAKKMTVPIKNRIDKTDTNQQKD